MNSKKTELDLINDFIDNFNPVEFSSDVNFEPSTELPEIAYERAKKIKDRMHRKDQMNDYFQIILDSEFVEDSDVCIDQSEIDALLEGCG